MTYYGQIRSPETKTEVRQAAKVLIGLGILFGLGALFGIVMWVVNDDPEMLILVVTLGGITPLLLAAGAYNIYYTRRMQHHPFMAKALANPAITVCVIMFVLIAVVFGAVGLLIYLK